MSDSSENAELVNAVQMYFDALYHCDTTLLDQVFHPSSTLFDVDQGAIFVDPIANFRVDVGSRPSPAAKQQEREEEIVMIDWLSPKSATVKVRLRVHQEIFVDHLCFVDGENGWQIVAKVWHLESALTPA